MKDNIINFFCAGAVETMGSLQARWQKIIKIVMIIILKLEELEE